MWSLEILSNADKSRMHHCLEQKTVPAKRRRFQRLKQRNTQNRTTCHKAAASSAPRQTLSHRKTRRLQIKNTNNTNNTIRYNQIQSGYKRILVVIITEIQFPSILDMRSNFFVHARFKKRPDHGSTRIDINRHRCQVTKRLPRELRKWHRHPQPQQPRALPRGKMPCIPERSNVVS